MSYLPTCFTVTRHGYPHAKLWYPYNLKSFVLLSSDIQRGCQMRRQLSWSPDLVPDSFGDLLRIFRVLKFHQGRSYCLSGLFSSPIQLLVCPFGMKTYVFLQVWGIFFSCFLPLTFSLVLLKRTLDVLHVSQFPFPIFCLFFILFCFLEDFLGIVFLAYLLNLFSFHNHL